MVDITVSTERLAAAAEEQGRFRGELLHQRDELIQALRYARRFMIGREAQTKIDEILAKVQP